MPGTFDDLIPQAPQPSASVPQGAPVIYGRPRQAPPMTANDEVRYRRDSQTLPFDVQKSIADAEKARLEVEAAKRAETLAKTEAQGKAAAFLTRAHGANLSYEETGVGPRSGTGQYLAENAPTFLNTLPSGIGNSPQRQVADSAQDEFIAATLRMDSGAAIPEQELERQRRIYFPMPGDGPEAIEQKRQARIRALQGLRESAGNLADRSIENAEISRQPREGASPGAAAMPGGGFDASFDPTQPGGGGGGGNGPLDRPELRPSGTDEVRVPLLDGGDGNTNLQAGQDRIAAEVQQLLTEGATKEQLDEYVARRGRELGINTPVFSQWGNADAVIKARDAGQQFQVGSPKIIYDRSDARGADPRQEASFVENVIGGAINPIGTAATAAGNVGEMVGLEGARDTAAAGARGIRSGVTLSFDDEIAALADAALGEGSGTFGQRYDQALGEQRATDAYDEENNFGARLVGQIAGSAVLPTKVPGSARAAFMTEARAARAAAIARGATASEARAEALAVGQAAARKAIAKQGTIEGAATGAAFGAGSAEGNLEDRVVGGLTGGAIGGGAGRVLGAVPELASRIGRGRLSPEQEALARRVAQAADAEGVEAGRPIADVTQRARMGNLEASVGGGTPIRESLARTERQIGERANEIGGVARQMGTVLDRETLGARIQGAGRRFIEQTGSKGKGGRLYDRAAKLAGSSTVRGHEAVGVIDRYIGELAKNPQTNKTLLTYLRDIRQDFVDDAGNLIAKDIGAIRDIRTGLRGEIDARALTSSRAEAIVSEALDAAGKDIQRDLGRRAPAALKAYKEADRFWRGRMTEIDQVWKTILGPKDRPFSGEQVVQKLKTMASEGGDNRGLDRVLNRLSKQEGADYVATLANALGKGAPEDEFSLQVFLNNTKGISPQAQETIFGPQGRKTIENLRLLSRELTATRRSLNNSGSGRVVLNRQFWMDVLKPILPAAAGGALGGPGGAVVGAAVGSAFAGLGAGQRRLSAKALMNPDLSRWLASAPTRSGPGQIRGHIQRLSQIAARNPAIAQDVTGLQQLLLRAANDNGMGAKVAASEGESDE